MLFARWHEARSLTGRRAGGLTHHAVSCVLDTVFQIRFFYQVRGCLVLVVRYMMAVAQVADDIGILFLLCMACMRSCGIRRFLHHSSRRDGLSRSASLLIQTSQPMTGFTPCARAELYMLTLLRSHGTVVIGSLKAMEP